MMTQTWGTERRLNRNEQNIYIYIHIHSVYMQIKIDKMQRWW